MAIDHQTLNATLANTGARWRALTTAPIVPHALGYSPGPDEVSLQTREVLAMTGYRHFRATAGVAPPSYPVEYDWRAATKPGLAPGNYVTPIRDQGQCGSCVSFGSVAALESAALIRDATPGYEFDRSEAFLFFCHEGVSGGDCEHGWNVTEALTSLQGAGTPDEQCFPYTDFQQPCNACPDWSARVLKTTSGHSTNSTSAMKSWIANHGPMIACFNVYEDFDAYSSGIYHHVSGAFRGGHCVCCIGYSDVEHAWICKNSWGPGWGEHGFFRIGYGQVGIDATMWALEI